MTSAGGFEIRELATPLVSSSQPAGVLQHFGFCVSCRSVRGPAAEEVYKVILKETGDAMHIEPRFVGARGEGALAPELTRNVNSINLDS